MLRSSALLFVFVAVLAGRTEARSFVPRDTLTKPLPSTASSKALDLRGGAGPLDVTDTAKVATAISLVNGIVVTLSQKKAAEIYGMPRSPTVDRYTEMIGSTLLSIAITAYCLFFKGTTAQSAVGVSMFPWIILSLKDVLNETPKGLGIEMTGSYLNLAITTVTAYCLLTGTNADTAWKFVTMFTTANGVLMALATETANKLWGYTNASSVETYLAKNHGYFLAGLGTFGLALNKGVDSMKAFGYSWIPLMAGLVDGNFISQGVEEHGIEKGPQYVWMLLMAAFIYTLAA